MEDDRLSPIFAALADPTRRAILTRLASGEATVTQLSEPFSMSMPAVSRHLKVLEHAGLISRRRNAQWRPCRLEAQPLGEAAGWLYGYRSHWEAGLDRLEAFLRSTQTAADSAPTAATAPNLTPVVERTKAPKGRSTEGESTEAAVSDVQAVDT